MYDGDMNEKFDEENTKHPTNQDSPIPSTSQDSPIPSTTQYSPIPMPRKKIKYERNSLNLAKFENCQMEVVEKCLGKWMVIKYSRSTVVMSIGMMHRKI